MTRVEGKNRYHLIFFIVSYKDSVLKRYIQLSVNVTKIWYQSGIQRTIGYYTGIYRLLVTKIGYYSGIYRLLVTKIGYYSGIYRLLVTKIAYYSGIQRTIGYYSGKQRTIGYYSGIYQSVRDKDTGIIAIFFYCQLQRQRTKKKSSP